MDPIFGGIISGIGGLAGAIGGFLNNNNSIDAAWQMMLAQQKFNAEQAQINRDWQEDMRETSYQTAMTDMKKGGLNPLLVGNIGGAAMPSSAPATSGGGNLPTFQNWMAQGVSSAVELAKTITQMQLAESQADKNQAEATLAREQSKVPAVTVDQMLATIEKIKGETFTEAERREMTAGQVAELFARVTSHTSAAGAYNAAAFRDTQAGNVDAARLGYLRDHGALPNTAQGYSGGSFSLPPKAQLDKDFPGRFGYVDMIGPAESRTGAWSGRSVPTDALAPFGTRPSAALSPILDLLVRRLQSRNFEASGRDPRLGRPSVEYFPPVD